MSDVNHESVSAAGVTWAHVVEWAKARGLRADGAQLRVDAGEGSDLVEPAYLNVIAHTWEMAPGHALALITEFAVTGRRGGAA